MPHVEQSWLPSAARFQATGNCAALILFSYHAGLTTAKLYNLVSEKVSGHRESCRWGALGLDARVVACAGDTKGMLGSGALSRQVLSSCAAFSRYACSCGASQALQRPAIASYRRSSGSLISWQIQHAQQSILQPRPGCAVPQPPARGRGICTSVSCKADSPKTVRDIVRELKKGECVLHPFRALYSEAIRTQQQSNVGLERDPETF